jgi:hypothetical protein
MTPETSLEATEGSPEAVDPMRCHPTLKRHGDETKKVIDGVTSRRLAKLTPWKHRPAASKESQTVTAAVEHMYASLPRVPKGRIRDSKTSSRESGSPRRSFRAKPTFHA